MLMRAPHRGVQASGGTGGDRLTHVQLSALLGVLKHHVACFWPCKRRSNLDAKVVRRMMGLEPFVDFARCDPAARGMLLKGLNDVHAALQQRFQELLFASTASADATWNKWVVQERDMTWRGMALAARGLQSYGAVLHSQLADLQLERAPGTPLMMLKAVRTCCSYDARMLRFCLLSAACWSSCGSQVGWHPSLHACLHNVWLRPIGLEMAFSALTRP